MRPSVQRRKGFSRKSDQQRQVSTTLQQGLGGLSPALEAWQQEIGFGAPAPALLGAAALDHGDDVQILAAAHRVMDEMGAGPEPEPDLRVVEGRRHLATRQQAHARRWRRRSADLRRERCGRVSATRDRRRRSGLSPRPAFHQRHGPMTGSATALDLGHLEAAPELDRTVGSAGGEQACVEVGAVKREIGRAVALLGDRVRAARRRACRPTGRRTA